MKTMRVFILATVLGACSCAPEAPSVTPVPGLKQAPAKKVETKVTEKAVAAKSFVTPIMKATTQVQAAGRPVKPQVASPVKVVPKAKALVTLKASPKTKAPVTLKAVPKAKPAVVHESHVPAATAKKVVKEEAVVPPKLKKAGQVKTAKPLVKPQVASPVKVAPTPKAPVMLKAGPKPKEALTLKATPKSQPVVKHESHVTTAPAKKVEAKAVKRVKLAKAIVAPKPSKGPVKPPVKAALLKAAPVRKSETKVAVKGNVTKVVVKKSETKVAVKVNATTVDASAKPVAFARVQMGASAPAPSPAAAPAGAGDWRKEYRHSSDPKELEWKWTTNKPGAYSIGTKAPRKLLPIGEGAYQSAEAVAQRTKDNSSDCESGKWNDCFLKHGGNLTDGHVYGNLKGKYGNAPQTKSEAAVTSFGLAALSLLLPSLVF